MAARYLKGDPRYSARRAASRAWAQRNRDHVNTYNREYRRKNRAADRAARQRWRDKNRAAIRLYSSLYNRHTVDRLIEEMGGLCCKCGAPAVAFVPLRARDREAYRANRLTPARRAVAAQRLRLYCDRHKRDNIRQKLRRRVRHGVGTTYRDAGCRCLTCTEAHRMDMRAYRARVKG